MTEQALWQTKTLDEMTDAEWEALCDGCGQCCLHKLIDADTDELYYTNVACDQLDLHTCQCRNYATRFELEPDCIKLTRENMNTFEWLPATCAYRLLDEGKGLPAWHPLVSGTPESMHDAGISVRDQCVYEIDVIDWEEHITNKPKWVR
ncbi:MAG: YcgN family cysteine cluster protein [Plesiomonas sp.]|nr:YcgN family cysteine cluster protein [Plesiomonas sp.]